MKTTQNVVHPIKVLHINRVAHLGGVERVILTLTLELKRLGDVPYLACPDEGELPRMAEERGIVIIPCAFDRMRITKNIGQLASYPVTWVKAGRAVLRACVDYEIEIIHAHHPVGLLYALPAIWRLGLPSLLHVHEILPARPLYRAALWVAARHVKCFVCVSEAGRDLVKSLGGEYAAKALLVHNGVDRQFLSEPPRPEVLPVTGPGPHIGVFGVIEPRKGQHVFIQAASLLASQYPTAHFWIIGQLALPDKAPYERELRDSVERLGLTDRVTFAGYQARVRAWMEAMDVVALASVGQESLSMVILEALTLGRAIVATRVGGADEAIRDGVTGRTVPPDNPERMAQAIEYLLSTDRVAMGKRASADAKARFSAESFARKFHEIYVKTIASNGAPERYTADI